MKEVLMVIACVMMFGCALEIGPLLDQMDTQKTSTARSIPSDMKVMTCRSRAMGGANVVRVDIPEQTNLDASLILAIRQSAVRHGKQKCLTLTAATVVIINRPEGQLIAATNDGIYWEEIHAVTESVLRQVMPPSQAIQAPEITRVIGGFALGLSLEGTLRAVANGMQDKSIMPLDTSLQQRFTTALRQRDVFRATRDNRIMTESARVVDGLNIHLFSLAPIKTSDAEWIVLRFYQNKLYEVAVQFKEDLNTLRDVLTGKYGSPQKVEKGENYLIWQDDFTVLTLYITTYKSNGVVYQDRVPTEKRQKNY